MSGDFLVVDPVDVTSDVLVSTTAIATEDEWDEYTVFAVDAVVRRFRDGHEYRFKSVDDGNVANDPALDLEAEFWVEDGATNPYAMYDGAIQSQTIAEDQLIVVHDLPADRIADTLYLANISATTLHVVVEDLTAEPSDRVVVDETYELVSTLGISDWHAYFFTPPRRLTELTVQGLGSYAGARLTVNLTAYGEIVACGALVAGFGKPLGKTMFGPRLSMRDFSLKEEDGLGNLEVVERPYRKTVQFQIAVRNADLDDVFATLVDYRARPILFLGSPRYGALAVYGFLKDFDMQMPGPRISYLNLNAESLT